MAYGGTQWAMVKMRPRCRGVRCRGRFLSPLGHSPPRDVPTINLRFKALLNRAKVFAHAWDIATAPRAFCQPARARHPNGSRPAAAPKTTTGPNGHRAEAMETRAA